MAAVSSSEDNFYRIEASPKGICLIINNFIFDCLPYLETGPADGENLTRTFRNLDFEIRYVENLSSDGMQLEMQRMQKTDHSNYDCFVCCISSHGGKYGVSGSRGAPLPVEKLQSYIFATQCQSLAGKPKVFFVDACQGNIEQTGIPQPKSAGQTRCSIADKTDFLVSYATTSDNVAWTSGDPSKGSRFFCLLTTLLDRHAKRTNLIQILQMVNSDLQKTSTIEALQVSEYRSTLSKDLNIYRRGKPKVTVNPSQSGTDGQSTTLVCDVQTCPPLTSLQWYKGGQPLTTSGSRHYTGGTIGTPSLTIRSVQLDDAGSYHCVASNSLGSTKSDTTQLTVHYKPKVTVRPSQTGTEGQSTTLVCDVQTCPPLTSLQWYKGRQPLTISSSRHYTGGTTDNPSLTIRSVKLDDAGSYHCVASNSLGSTESDTTQLTVHCKPKVKVQPSWTVAERQSLTIPCVVEAVPCLTSLKWHKDGHLLDTSDAGLYLGGTTSNPSLTILSVALRDAGSYHCKASNALGSTVSGTTKLSVEAHHTASLQQQPLSPFPGHLMGMATVANPGPDNAGQVLIIGRTGNGKSTLGNLLLGTNRFQVNAGMFFRSSVLEIGETSIGHKRSLKVVDTPDVLNLGIKAAEIPQEIARWKAVTSSAPFVILLTVRCDVKYTSEEYAIYRQIKEVWGDDREFCQRLMVAFTFGDTLDKPIEHVLPKVGLNLQGVLKDAGHRYVVFDPQADQMTRQAAVSEVLDFMAHMGY